MRVQKINQVLIEKNAQIFPFLYVLVMFFGLVETVTYSGFIRQYLFLDFLFFYWLLIISGLTLLVSYGSRPFDQHQDRMVAAVFTFNGFLIIPVLFTFYFLKAIELKHYANFVYSTYHLQIDNLFFMVAMNIFILVLSSLLIRLNLRAKILSLRRTVLPQSTWKMLIPVALFISFVNFELKDINDIISNTLGPVRQAIHFSKFSKEDRRRYQFSEIYNYVQFLKKYTPENATILIPPQAFPWPATGNILYFRYFLYPRHLLNGKLNELGPDFSDKIEYVLLAHGEETQVTGSLPPDWPKFDVPAAKVIYIVGYKDNGEAIVKEVEGPFNHLDPRYAHGWGLIVLKK